MMRMLLYPDVVRAKVLFYTKSFLSNSYTVLNIRSSRPTPFILTLRILSSIFFSFPLVLRWLPAGSRSPHTRSSFSSRTFTIFLRPAGRLLSSRCLVDFPPDRLFYLADPLFLLLPAILLRPGASGSPSLTPSSPR